MCLCSHFPIKEICVIRNRVNGVRAEVGNVCVKKFLGLPSGKIFEPEGGSDKTKPRHRTLRQSSTRSRKAGSTTGERTFDPETRGGSTQGSAPGNAPSVCGSIGLCCRTLGVNSWGSRPRSGTWPGVTAGGLRQLTAPRPAYTWTTRMALTQTRAPAVESHPTWAEWVGFSRGRRCKRARSSSPAKENENRRDEPDDGCQERDPHDLSFEAPSRESVPSLLSQLRTSPSAPGEAPSTPCWTVRI